MVEDEPTVRAITVRALAQLGYQTLEASNGQEALSVIERHAGAIDLLLTDVVMPQMSGKELTERVRAVRPQIKVLYTSGYTDNAVVHG